MVTNASTIFSVAASIIGALNLFVLGSILRRIERLEDVLMEHGFTRREGKR